MLQVIRALELPAEEDLLPNTIYLTPEYSEDGSLDHRLAITVTGTNAQVFRSSLESWEVANMIADAVVKINEGPNGNDGLDQLKAAVPVLATRLDNKDQEIANINGVILGETGVAAAHTRIDVLRDNLDAAVIASGGSSTTYTDTKHAEALAGIAAVQAELNVTQAGVGLNAAGQFVARGVYDETVNPTGAHFIGTSSSIIGAVNALDTVIAAIETEIYSVIHPELGNLASDISTEIGQRTGEDANIRGEIAVHVGDLETADQNLQAQITGHSDELAGINATIAAMGGSLGSGLSELDTRVTTAEADIGALETGLAATNATVAANAAAATTYTNTKHAEALAYANNAVATAVGALDLSNSAVYAADIAARDALTLTKNTFVMVADATADATVDTGAALYFYNLATTSYVKVAEYESMDLFPNQAVLQDLSDVGGQLYYKGAAVATVHNTVNEW